MRSSRQAGRSSRRVFAMKCLLFICLSIVFCACSSQEQTVQTKQVRKGLEKFNGGYEVSKSGEAGQVMSSDKRSHFENKVKGSQYQKPFQNKGFKKSEFESTSFAGADREARKKTFGRKESQTYKAPHFATKKAQLRQQTQLNKKYQKATYKSHQAREAGRHSLSRKSDERVAKRRQVYRPPSMNLSPVQGSQLSVQDTNSLLGR